MTDQHSPLSVSLDKLAPGKPVHFEFMRGDEQLGGFIVIHDGQIQAYVNRCPHISFSLDFGDGVLMDPSGKFIRCQVHGAQFLPESGECFWGPALGQRLEVLPLVVRDKHALIDTSTTTQSA